MTKTINLYAAEGCWLYKTCPADVHRDFMKSCTCPIDDVPNWNECTDQERIDYEEEWQRTHPEPNDTQEPDHDPLDVHWENPEEQEAQV